MYFGEIATRLERATKKVNGTYWDKVLKNDGTVGYVARTTYDYESNYKEYLISVGGDGSHSDNNNSSNDNGNNNNNSSNNNSQDVKKGDVNTDGKIDSMDMYILIQHILGNSILQNDNFKRADINDDGKLDAMDMYMIIQKILNN